MKKHKGTIIKIIIFIIAVITTISLIRFVIEARKPGSPYLKVIPQMQNGRAR